MQIISHRGYWHSKPERNQPVAFHRSFDLGYGTETDVRDVAGQLVISHDMPNGHELTLDELLKIMAGRNLPLAMNIKADGLTEALKAKFDQYKHTNWFVFDMAVPDMRSYLQAGVPTYTRHSDVEPSPAYQAQAVGIWLDAFAGEWFSNPIIVEHLRNGKHVCVVSPELHGRSPIALWQQLSELKTEEKLMLCTDIPEDATNFFK